MSYHIHNAEFTAWAKGAEFEIEFSYERKFHAVLCDPPYGIAFMGKKWDDLGGPAAFQAQVTQWGEALKPLLYPGALVFMFGGTRMWHRMAAGMEDAGFHLWDTLMWLYGQGFPKALDISKLIDKSNGDERPIVGRKSKNLVSKGWREKEGRTDLPLSIMNITLPASDASATWSGFKTPQLKPAWEPILCFRAPNDGLKYAELALQYGSGALNVDGARIGTDLVGWGGAGREQGRTYEGGWGEGQPRPVEGRYPANVALECTCEETKTVETTETCKADEDGDTPNYKNKVYGRGMGGVKWTGTRPVSVVVHTDPNCPAFMLDNQTGNVGGGFGTENRAESKGRYGNFSGATKGATVGFGDSGGASRFFYVAKASRAEREAGLDAFEPQAFGMSNQAKAEVKRGTTEFENSEIGVNSVKKVRNNHPTVKPIELNRWLATLLLPPQSVEPRRILVPFAGAGSEMIGCLRAGWDEVVGVELMEEYCKIAEARLGHWTGTTGTSRRAT